MSFWFGRSSGTWTHGLLVPNQARYQTALYPEIVQIPISRDWDLLAARLGFEPRQTESESVVLPLHNRAMCNRMLSCDNVYYYTRLSENVNSFFEIFWKNFCRQFRRDISWKNCKNKGEALEKDTKLVYDETNEIRACTEGKLPSVFLKKEEQLWHCI